MFGRTGLDAVRLPYSRISKRGVRFVRDRVTAIDPVAKSATTETGTYDADYLRRRARRRLRLRPHTPGLAEANEFYSVAGAARLAGVLPDFTSGRAVVGVCDAPFKCPPAPSECALLLHDLLTVRGVRDDCEIALVMPFGNPVPPSPDTSAALLAAFAEWRNRVGAGVRSARSKPIKRCSTTARPSRSKLFLGVPKHRAPDVVQESGMAENGYNIPSTGRTLATKYPGVYAVGDVATVGTPKAGVFGRAPGERRSPMLFSPSSPAQSRPRPTTARLLQHRVRRRPGRRVDVDFFSGRTRPAASRSPPSISSPRRSTFGSSRRARWFGLD